jgi:hypothetical protein
VNLYPYPGGPQKSMTLDVQSSPGTYRLIRQPPRTQISSPVTHRA